jgi:hypothetical protein
MEKQVKKLINKLNDGVVIFTYRKTNGEVRNAAGTNNPNCLAATQPVINDSTKSTIKYFDVVKQDWRSLKVDNIVRIGSSVLA